MAAAPSQPSGASALAEPFARPDFRLLFAGQLVSVLGDKFYAVALPWFVLATGGSAERLGWLLTAYGLPRLATTLAGGWLSDRLHPRRVMLLSDWMRALLVAALAALVLAGAATTARLAALLVALGAFEGLFFPASAAIMPQLLPERLLQSGNSLMMAWAQLATLLGPALAGPIVAHARPGVAFAVDAATFVLSALTLMRMRAGRAPVAVAARAPAALSMAGFVRRSRWFQALLGVLVVANALQGCVVEVALPMLARALHSSATGFGLLLACFGGGALAGALGAGLLGARIRRGLDAMHLFAAQSLAIVALGRVSSPLAAAGCLAVWGALNGMGNVAFLTLAQRALPRELLGRAMGLFLFVSLGLYPLSVAAGGVAVDRFGAGAVIACGGLVTAVAVAIAYGIRDLRQLGLQPPVDEVRAIAS